MNQENYIQTNMEILNDPKGAIYFSTYNLKEKTDTPFTLINIYCNIPYHKTSQRSEEENGNLYLREVTAIYDEMESKRRAVLKDQYLNSINLLDLIQTKTVTRFTDNFGQEDEEPCLVYHYFKDLTYDFYLVFTFSNDRTNFQTAPIIKHILQNGG